MINLDVQREVTGLPTDDELLIWVRETLDLEQDAESELTIRFVSETEISELNEQYRDKKGSTNILSFPFEVPLELAEEVELSLLGDLVICSEVIKREAVEQKKDELAHWAHMIVHGVLHLLGYDHMDDEQAKIMERKEINILSKLGYSDPYREI